MNFMSRQFLVLWLAAVLVSSGCGPSEHKTLRVWQTETDGAAVEHLQETIALFERAHPNVDVQLESVAWSSLSRKLSSAIEARNEPDIAHLEPFMAASLYHQNLLLPIDDVIEDIQNTNDDVIYEGVLDLQEFDGRHYGIAYAVGTTAWAYRKDIADRLELAEPKTWAEYVEFAKALHSNEDTGGLPILLPGGDPFFIDQLFAELVANNGGILFDPQERRPLLRSSEVVETLDFFRAISAYVDPGWQTQKYLDQFNRLGRGEAANVPVTYARAAKAIMNAVQEEGGNSAGRATPEVFAVMPQPTGPSYSGPPVATIDCEPFAVFRSTEKRGTTQIAKDFLRLFYEKDRYLGFVSHVPIHLTPIFVNMTKSREYQELPLIGQWRQWADQTDRFLADSRMVRPILMPDTSAKGRQLPFLLELQASKILTKAVSDVIQGEASPTEAAESAQQAAEVLVEALGYRAW